MLRDFLAIAFPSIFIVNLFFAVFIIFFERKNPSSVWSWLMVTAFMPPFGFLIYLVFGFEGRKYRIFKSKSISDENFYSDFYSNKNTIIYKQLSYIESKEKINAVCGYYSNLAVLNIISADSPLSMLWNLKIYSDGKEKFTSLFKDIEAAKNTILIEYYIIRQDDLGTALKNLLIKKSQQGVNVYLLYDGMGNILNKSEFLDFEKYENIYTSVFLPPKFIRINYRCHRKICIIDNKKAYIGGFNVGMEYMGLSKKFGNWRDCHISFEGNAVVDLSLRFISDFNFFSLKKLSSKNINYIKSEINSIPVQIVSGGPDCRCDNLLNSFFKLISTARKSIYIQTPYFVPDDSILEALKTAALSGISVKIMIPAKPDHPFVYWASLSYLGELLSSGVECYGYTKGFLHSKLIVCDEFVTSIGTANLDIRSLKLNFETSAIIYDRDTSKKFAEIFNKDLYSCEKITFEKYTNRSAVSKIKESLSRLISPML